MDYSGIDDCVHEHLGRTFPSCQVVAKRSGKVLYSKSYGFVDPEAGVQPTDPQTRFDLASVSKLLTVTAFLSLVQTGDVGLDQRVSEVVPKFSGERLIISQESPSRETESSPVGEAVDVGDVTFRNLLAHTSGLPAWVPLWRMPSREQRRRAVVNSELAYPIGTRVLYSDLGLMLLGFALEKLVGDPLDQIVHRCVTDPLGLTTVGYGPIPFESAAATEFSPHRNRRMRGEVHDENAWSLGGVAGHAGLFGSAEDLACFGEMYRRQGDPLLSSELVAEMTSLQAQEGAVRRGLGFALWSPDPEASSNPLSRSAFGHLGFTGTSLWIDPEREAVIACLTNRVYYGRDKGRAMDAFRVMLHRTVCEIVDAA